MTAFEAEVFWRIFLRFLVDRGFRGVKLVIADDHESLRAAAYKIFHATLQRCRTHWMRNALNNVRAKQRPAVAAMLKTIVAQETAKEAHVQWKTVADVLRDQAPKLAAMMDGAREDGVAFTTFPKDHRPKISRTKSVDD